MQRCERHSSLAFHICYHRPHTETLHTFADGNAPPSHALGSHGEAKARKAGSATLCRRLGPPPLQIRIALGSFRLQKSAGRRSRLNRGSSHDSCVQNQRGCISFLLSVMIRTEIGRGSSSSTGSGTALASSPASPAGARGTATAVAACNSRLFLYSLPLAHSTEGTLFSREHTDRYVARLVDDAHSLSAAIRASVSASTKSIHPFAPLHLLGSKWITPAASPDGAAASSLLTPADTATALRRRPRTDTARGPSQRTCCPSSLSLYVSCLPPPSLLQRAPARLSKVAAAPPPCLFHHPLQSADLDPPFIP